MNGPHLAARARPLALAAGLTLWAAGLAASPEESDRERAWQAIAAARNAISQTTSAQPARQKASSRLKEAEALWSKQQYGEAARAADEAWQSISEGSSERTKFSVEVASNGKTAVHAETGRPVQVEAEGDAKAVYAGQKISVEVGKPPPSPEMALGRPSLLKPAPDAILKLKSTQKPGGLLLSWKAVSGAKVYEVSLEQEGGGAEQRLRVNAPATHVGVPNLTEGRYRWTVRAVGDQESSDPSSGRFKLVKDSLRLEGKTQWR